MRLNFSNFVMTLVMLTIFGVMLTISSGYPPAARFITFVIGIPAIALCLLQLGLDLYRLQPAESASSAGSAASNKRPPAYADQTMPATEIRRRELIMWLYFLALIGGILMFGFYLAVPVFMVTFLRLRAEASWRLTLLLASSASLFLYFIFEKVLRVPLFGGFITERLTDWISG
jgi:hypothetical protein